MQAVGSDDVWRRQKKGCALWFDLMVVLGVYLHLCVSGVSGHGYLIDPPSRSSEWRVGFPNPINYSDNQLYCGGFNTQWNQNGGKCGVCGDPWDVAPPRPNEVGGMYANGIIVRQYSVGQEVEIGITITAQHGGYYEFRLCPKEESIDAPTTQECLDANLLEVMDSSSKTRYQLPSSASTGSFKVKVKLPEGLTCRHCVLQWKWHVGNSWGVGPDGVGCLGCGPQEEFINCADISISFGNSDERPASPSSKSTLPRTISARTSPNIRSTTSRKLNIVTRFSTLPTKRPAESCRAIGQYEGDAGMDSWCVTNCALSNCPMTHCTCGQNPFTKCRSRGSQKSNAMDKWCVSNCAGGNCPQNLCEC